MKTALNLARTRLGFTLVELMVVVGVIGILSAIVYANFGSARAVARDDIRKTDLKDLQVAIELYKAQNGHYPWRCLTDNDVANSRSTTTASWSGGTGVTGDFQCADDSPEYIKGLVPDFIAKLPIDPTAGSGGTNNYGYLYKVDSTGYKLIAYNTVEVNLISDYSDEFARCPSTVVPTANCPTTPTTLVTKTYGLYKGSSTAEGW